MAVGAGEGRLDILVNNAGVNVRQPAFDVTEEAWDLVLDTNLKGLFFTAQAAGCVMRDQDPPGGSIVNVASVVGLVGYYDRAAYCSSKAGVDQPFPGACHRVGSARDPGECRLPDLRRDATDAGLVENEAIKSDILGRTPAGRLATPEEVAAAIVFLAGSSARMITGTALTIDGGWTAI